MQSSQTIPIRSTGSATVELVSVVRMSDGRLSATFADGDRRWQVRCTAAQVQTFSAFQRIVASKHGIWIRHDCQDERRARLRDEQWQDEVAAAFDAGAKG
jgi:hypothetical protein